MMRALWLIFLFLSGGLAGHFIVAMASPRLDMQRAYERLSRHGERINVWTHAPRVTKESRRVVRPSPELVYSICAYDLSGGPVRVTATNWDGYLSVSFYQENTDNFAVVNNRGLDPSDDIEILLVSNTSASSSEPRIIQSPSARGVVLQRRLAPTSELFSEADDARRSDRCEAVSTQ